MKRKLITNLCTYAGQFYLATTTDCEMTETYTNFIFLVVTTFLNSDVCIGNKYISAIHRINVILLLSGLKKNSYIKKDILLFNQHEFNQQFFFPVAIFSYIFFFFLEMHILKLKCNYILYF